MHRRQGIVVAAGLDRTERGAECHPVGGSVRRPLRGPERIVRAGRLPESGVQLTGARCA